VQSTTDSNGCTIEQCVETICPPIAPIQCAPGYEATTAYDSNSCPLLQCIPVTVVDAGPAPIDAMPITIVPPLGVVTN
jgi:hypothetical protein